ncbi:MAG: hypothetical protein LBO73_00720 [Holosporaceae bacterium]|jgi:TPR repeat protein|nr:hypothetical protein [Holosporaceae bacterium]
MKKISLALLLISSVRYGSDAMQVPEPDFDYPFSRAISVSGLSDIPESDCERAKHLWKIGIKMNNPVLMKEAIETDPTTGFWIEVVDRLSAPDGEKHSSDIVSDKGKAWLEHLAAKSPFMAYNLGVALFEGRLREEETFGYEKYYREIKIEKNETEGLKWLRSAAKRDHYQCLRILRTFLLRGDEARTTEFAEIYAAADKENPIKLACMLLSGSFFLMGEEHTFAVVKDEEKGLALLRKYSADNTAVKKFLGFLLMTGGGVDNIRIQKNEKEGLALLRQVAKEDLLSKWQVGVLFCTDVVEKYFKKTCNFKRKDKEGLAMLYEVALTDPSKAEKLGTAFLRGYMSNPFEDEKSNAETVNFPQNPVIGKQLLMLSRT